MMKVSCYLSAQVGTTWACVKIEDLQIFVVVPVGFSFKAHYLALYKQH